MKGFHLNKVINRYFIATYCFILMMTIILMFYNFFIAIGCFVVMLIIGYFTLQAMRYANKQRYDDFKHISYEVKNASDHLFHNMPIGLIIYDNQFNIKWANPYIMEVYNGTPLIGKTLMEFSNSLMEALDEDKETFWLSLHDIQFKVESNKEGKTLYFFNRSEDYKVRQLYKNERPVLANIYLDNYDEVARNMDDNLKSQINSEITATLNEWAKEHEFYIKRTAQDRFLAILTEENLQQLEASKFNILNKVRQMHIEKLQRNPITLSIGVGSGNVSIVELAKLAQLSLDLVLGRGGDQVAIRDESGHVRFYGGKTNPMEKRTRVRARVISHALADLVKDSDEVFIMGHRSPDMDSLGSTIGVLKIVQANDVNGYIVYDDDDVTTGVNRAMEKVKADEILWQHFITPQRAEDLFTDRSLVVVVDTHRPTHVTHKRLLVEAAQKVIIDHHRRGEDFVENPTLVYMEPYASSTSELVTELIEYQPRQIQLSSLEATVLLAGIIVDTKSFALRTGSRTFDAASYLRIKGADPQLIQQFLKEDLTTYIKRSKLIEKAQFYDEAIAVVKADPDELYNHIIIAQSADTLLTIDGVKASFVIAYSDEKTISISARSLGDINVQMIMENMSGGGHLTNAATQLKNMSLDEAEALLIAQLEEL